MIAYGYEVKGWKEALADVQRNLDNPGCRINWNLFKTGDTYYDGTGNGYEVTVDHEAKTVILD